MKRPILVLVLALALAALLWQVDALFDKDREDPSDLLPPGAEGSEEPEAPPGLVDLPLSDTAPPSLVRQEVATTPASLDAAAETGSLLLRTLLPDGTPVPAVSLFLSHGRSPRLGHGTTEHVTDEEGEARVAGLPSGEVRIHSPRGAWKNVEVIAGEETEVTIELRDVVDVHGIVRDPAGRPVAGADVWVASWRRDWLGTRRVARTRADGTFAVRYVSTNRSLGATAEGFAKSELTDLELVDTETSPVEIELVLAAGGGNLRGTVRDPEGRPVAHALVAVGESPTDQQMRNDTSIEESWGARVETTDESGSFAFTGLDAGLLPVHVAAPAFPVYEGEVEILAGETAHHDVPLAPGMAVRGVVTNAEGEPLPDALVLALDAPFVDPFPTQGPTDKGAPFHRPATRSDEGGVYRLDFLPPGDVHLYVSKGTSYWDDGNFVGVIQKSLHGEVGETLVWNPILSVGHFIRGRVLYADGTPMEEVFVTATDSDERRYTEDTEEPGEFVIPGLENRPYTVSVQLWDAPDEALPLVQEDVWPSNADLVLTANYSKEVEEEGRASIRIDDRADRITGRGAVVFAHEGGWYFTGEEDGVFSTTLPAGRYQARALAGDTVVGVGEWFDLAAGEERDVGTIRTRPVASLVVTVSRPPELADGRVRAKVLADGRDRFGGVEFPAGVDELVFDDLLEGPVEVVVWGDGVARESRAVEVQGAAPTPVHFPLRAAIRASIHVASTDSEPLGRVTVTVRRPNGDAYEEFVFRSRHGIQMPLEVDVTVPLGRFQVEVATSTGRTASGELVVTSLGEDVSLSLVLE